MIKILKHFKKNEKLLDYYFFFVYPLFTPSLFQILSIRSYLTLDFRYIKQVSVP